MNNRSGNCKPYILLTLILFLLACSKSEEEQLATIALPYKDIIVIDSHNHDASNSTYKKSIKTWDKYGIDKVVLFGDISEPSAQKSDLIAYKAWLNDKERFIPFIAGINIHDTTCLDYIRERFDKGIFGIGEVVAASTNSPVASKVIWKGGNAMYGFFPEIYNLCAQYHKPILLHIDPLSGFQITKLKEAATAFPNTNIIIGHANAFSSIADLESLLKNYSNIYLDFFAGFTSYNAESSYTLSDFVPLISAYPDRFVVSTDSGYGISYDEAYRAIFELFNLLDRDVVIQIAGKNIMRLAGIIE